MNYDIRQAAQEAIAIIDRDGWTKGYLTNAITGAHCIGGALNIALHGYGSDRWVRPSYQSTYGTYGSDRWVVYNPVADLTTPVADLTTSVYAPVVKVIRELFPDRLPPIPPGYENYSGVLFDTHVIAWWNNDARTTLADIRAVLTAVAAG